MQISTGKSATGQSTRLRRNQLCPCNSGLRYKDCCARETAERVEMALNEAKQHYRHGNLPAAEQACLTILGREPDHTETLRFLVRLHRQAKQPAKAVKVLRHLVSVEPEDDDLLSDLANTLYQGKQLLEAEQYARRAVAANPNNAQAHNLVGMILADSHRYEEAELYYREVLKLHVPVAGLCANLAAMKVKLGRLDEAEFLYRETLRLEPDNIDGLLDWIRLRESRRDLDGAWKLMATALARRPDYLPCYYVEATLYRREKRFQQALASLDKAAALLAETGTEPTVAYLDQRGQALDRLGRFDEAFAAYQEANDRIRRLKGVVYKRKKALENCRRLKAFFTRDRLTGLPRADDSRDIESGRARPLFIIGFPRSGTTLVEQILAGHPMIAPGDELPFIWRLSRIVQGTLQSRHPYPECLAGLDTESGADMLLKFRSYYLVNVESRAIYPDGIHFFTDKMPLNETHLGLVNLLFPGAPIIHLVRHPLDVVLSTFFTDLTHGYFCSYQLETAAAHYALIFDLLEHYRDNLELRYLPLRYEELVAEPEKHVRRLLEFIGEPWDERCLEFHRSNRVARTASYAQVTEKVHSRSVYRFRNYRRHLEPIIPILRPAIEKLGYPLD